MTQTGTDQTKGLIGATITGFLTIGLIFGLGCLASVVGAGDTPWSAFRTAVAYWLATVAIAAVLSLPAVLVLLPFQKKIKSPFFAAFVMAVPVVALFAPEAVVFFSNTEFHDSLSPKGKLQSYLLIGVVLLLVSTILLRLPLWRKAANILGGAGAKWAKVVLGVYALCVISLTVTWITTIATGSHSNTKTTDRPNIILIVVDAMRTRSLGCYGGTFDVSPTIDKLADTGLRIEGTFSSGPASVPGHASILFGQGVEEHRAFWNQHRVETDSGSVASKLKERGYWSFGICENPLISADAGFAHGFDFYWSTGAPNLNGAPVDFVVRQVAALQIARRLLRLDFINWNTQGFLRKRYEPFFGFLQYLPVHYPYVDRRDSRWATPERHDQMRTLYEQGQFINNTSRPTREVARTHTNYLGSINYADWLIARLMEILEKRKLLENTVLIITADHGENIGEHGDRYATKHGGYFNSSLEIPLVVSSPSLGIRGEVLQTLTGADRIADLILDVASDNSHLLAGRLGDVRRMIEKTEHFAYARPCFVLFDDSLKAVVKYDDPEEPTRLFRWREDPWDRNDLSGDLVEETNQRVARIQEIVRANDLMNALKKPTPVDEKRLRHLRALGYID